jgi:translation initiation factor IF-2
VLGFNVKVEAKAVKSAKAATVEIKLYSIVYELIDQVREAMLGLLEPLTRETVIGHAEVRQIFKLNRGRVAGSFVMDGRIHRKAHARVLRGGIPVFDGRMSTLRRFKDEVEEVRTNFECGIRLGDFNEYEEGDVIECYKLEKYAQTL